MESVGVFSVQRGSLTAYVLARVAQLLPIVLIVVVVNFLLIRLAPGDPTAYLIGDAPVSEEFAAELRQRLGLDAPLFEQLLIYLGNVARGDFGYSFVSRAPVLDVLDRLPATLLLMTTQYVIAIVAGIFLGVTSARHQVMRWMPVSRFCRWSDMPCQYSGSARC